MRFQLSHLLAALVSSACAQSPPPPLQPNPLAGVVSTLREFAGASGPVTPTGFTKATYLSTMAGVVDWFVPYQNQTTGAIIDPDPNIHEEKEYSTPTFAHAAATLVAHANRSDLTSAAALALSCSIRELAQAKCATSSCDFFAVPVMRAFDLLSPFVSPSLVETWTAGLKNISHATWEYTGQNWELTAAAGEYDRLVKRGWVVDPSLNWTFWESRIDGLIARGYFSAEGMFLDNVATSTGLPSPTAYDAFGSSYPAIMLAEGYNSTGAYKDYLEEVQIRGVWTRAAYQSPLGEQPVGGRSNQHQFAEATLCAVAELYAAKAAAAGDALSACQLKRSAALYHRSVQRWLRSDGALQITKNWFLNYSMRFGFMGYSFMSNYNLLPMSWLALAYEYADDSIPECAAIADVGGAAVAIENPNMRKVYASVAGTYVELNTGADPEFDATGFNRYHYDACGMVGHRSTCRLKGLLGPSAAPGISGNAGVSLNARNGAPLGGLATGLVWAFETDAPEAPRRSLANFNFSAILGVITRSPATNSPTAGVAFETQYIMWADGILVTESYFLPPSGGVVNVTSSISFPGERALFTLLADAAVDAAHTRAEDASLQRTVFSPPQNPAAAAAVSARDFAAFRAALPAAAAPSVSRLRSFGVSFPVMVFDGTTNYTVALPGQWEANALLVQPPSRPAAGEGALAFRVTPPEGRELNFTLDTDVLYPSRNGLLAPFYAELVPSSDSPLLVYSLEVVDWAAGI